MLTETHLDERIDDCTIFLESLSNIIQRKDGTNAGGGLLIYAKDEIRMVRTHELENSIDETIWVEINANYKGKSFLLCNSYRAQWTDPDYWYRLTYAIELATQINENIVLVGDFISNLFCENNNKLVDILNSFCFLNVIDKPTRVTENSSTLLDPIILSENLICAYSDVIKVSKDISEHDAAIAYINCPEGISTTFKREVWQYDKIDLVEFNNNLDETNWSNKIGKF